MSEMRFFSFRRVLALAVVAFGLLAGPGAQASSYTPIRGTDFFAPNGVWNQPLAANAPLAKNSSTLSGTLNWEVANYGPWINTSSYSTPVYTVAANQPNVVVILDQTNPLLAADFAQVPLPPDARPAAGTDG